MSIKNPKKKRAESTIPPQDDLFIQNKVFFLRLSSFSSLINIPKRKVLLEEFFLSVFIFTVMFNSFK